MAYLVHRILGSHLRDLGSSLGKGATLEIATEAAEALERNVLPWMSSTHDSINNGMYNCCIDTEVHIHISQVTTSYQSNSRQSAVTAPVKRHFQHITAQVPFRTQSQTHNQKLSDHQFQQSRVLRSPAKLINLENVKYTSFLYITADLVPGFLLAV